MVKKKGLKSVTLLSTSGRYKLKNKESPKLEEEMKWYRLKWKLMKQETEKPMKPKFGSLTRLSKMSNSLARLIMKIRDTNC